MNKGKFAQIGVYDVPEMAFVAGFMEDANKFKPAVSRVCGLAIAYLPVGARKGPAARAQRGFERWLLKCLVFLLVLAPIQLWPVVLIVLPHIGLFIASISEKVGPREYETGRYNYAASFKESLY